MSLGIPSTVDNFVLLTHFQPYVDISPQRHIHKAAYIQTQKLFLYFGQIFVAAFVVTCKLHVVILQQWQWNYLNCAQPNQLLANNNNLTVINFYMYANALTASLHMCAYVCMQVWVRWCTYLVVDTCNFLNSNFFSSLYFIVLVEHVTFSVNIGFDYAPEPKAHNCNKGITPAVLIKIFFFFWGKRSKQCMNRTCTLRGYKRCKLHLSRPTEAAV